MIRYAVLFIALLIFVSLAFALVLAALTMLAMACVVGIPLFLTTKRWMRRKGLAPSGLNPVDRLKTMYLDGKIDLFEFERRVAHLIATER